MNLHRKGRGALVAALVIVVAMAFRVSWNALRDIAGAVGADETGAALYPFVVDGLMALALIATLVLDGPDKKFALRVLGAYTVASLVLNYVHGLVPELHGGQVQWGRLAELDKASWILVLLATSLPVGSIYFGSDLVAKVLHHRPVEASSSTVNAEESAHNHTDRSTADQGQSTRAPVNRLTIPKPVQVGFLKPTLPVKLPPPSGVPTAIEQTPARPVRAVAAESTRPRRATGRVPDAARSPRPKRSADELLAEARKVSADWTDKALTAEALRKAVHTSAEKSRTLRDALRAERAARALS